MKMMKKGIFYRKNEEKAGLLDKKERRVERKGEKTGGKMVSWLILIGIMVFVGFVGRATHEVISGSGGSWDWSVWDDDDGVGGVDPFESSFDSFDDDIYYSPIYSHFPCNIHYDPWEDDTLSVFDDDDWMRDDD
jgi:hypothetical protein